MGTVWFQNPAKLVILSVTSFYPYEIQNSTGRFPLQTFRHPDFSGFSLSLRKENKKPVTHD